MSEPGLIKKKNFFNPDKAFRQKLKAVLGFSPRKYQLYQLALIHKSASNRFSKKHDVHNERLEFLGDAILDTIIAEHLYSQFPDRDEGFLTQLRSKIVNRETLKSIAMQMGIGDMIIARHTQDNQKALYGDALEAIIGAIYLDKGYKKTKRFIVEQLLGGYINLDQLAETEVDFKSRIIEWGQKHKKDINFTCQEQENGNQKSPVFVSHLLIFDDIVGMGMGKSKKEAEQNAARQAISSIGI